MAAEALPGAAPGVEAAKALAIHNLVRRKLGVLIGHRYCPVLVVSRRGSRPVDGYRKKLIGPPEGRADPPWLAIRIIVTVMPVCVVPAMVVIAMVNAVPPAIRLR